MNSSKKEGHRPLAEMPHAKLWIQDFEALPKKEKARLANWLRSQAEFLENEDAARDDEIAKGYVARLWPMKTQS